MVLEGANVVLDFKGGRYRFPAEMQYLLGTIARRSSFSAADLSESVSAEARLSAIRYLYEIGFLRSVQ